MQRYKIEHHQLLYSLYTIVTIVLVYSVKVVEQHSFFFSSCVAELNSWSIHASIEGETSDWAELVASTPTDMCACFYKEYNISASNEGNPFFNVFD